MSRIHRRRAVILLAAALGLALVGWAWLRPGPTRFDDGAFQLGLSAWGGRSQPIPRLDVDRRLSYLRRPLGDELYLGLVGSEGRMVGTHRPGATCEQLAGLLTVQPIIAAQLSGQEAVDDGWIAGLRDRPKIRGLFLDGTGVTDRSVGVFLEMTGLEQLGLCDTAISDEAVARLIKLPSLGRLMVGGPNIRAIQLADRAVVDGQGRPASVAAGTLSIRGRLAAPGLPGVAGQVRVMVRTSSDRPRWDCIPYGWNASRGGVGPLVEDSPGLWSFDVPVDGIPAGTSTVEIWVDWTPAVRAKLVNYRLRPFSVDLAPDIPSQVAGPAQGR